MRLTSEVKVGLIVTSGIAVLIAIYWFLGGLGLRAATYPIYAVFSTVQKLDNGALVRMAGVKIGVVLNTSLTRGNQARVEMRIDKRVRIPRDSVACATTGAFIGEYYVDIKPGTSRLSLKRGERIATEMLAQPDRILQQASDILMELRKSTRGLSELLGDKEVLVIIKATLRATKKAAESASELAAASRALVENASPEVMRVLQNLDGATAGACRVAESLENLVAADIRPNVKSVLESAAAAVHKLDAAVEDARNLIAELRSSSGMLNAALAHGGGAVTQAEEMMTKLNEASEGVKSLATDVQLQQDIRTAVRNAAEASRQIKELAEALNRKYGRGRSGTEQRAQIPDCGLTVNSLWNTSQGTYRFDANYTFSVAGDNFARVGVFNAGEQAGLNLQAGKTFGNTALRYGLYDSRVGFGFDQRLGKSMLFSGDVFRPNKPQMELRGVFRIAPSIGLYGGALDMLHESSRDVFLGVRYQNY